MRDILRTLALGLLAGFALSLARAPVGAVLMSVPAVTAIDAALYRALALVVIALAVSRARVLSAPPSYGLLTLGALLGFALHGLLLANRVEVGGLPTELVPHFFRSLADTLGAALHVSVRGDNTHHMVEACFKATGRAIRQAKTRRGTDLPSTKGTL